MRIERADLALDRGRDRGRFTVGTDHERHEWVSEIGMWKGNCRRRIINQTVVSHIADNADDLGRLRRFKHCYIQSSPDRIFVRKVFTRECLIDQDDVFGFSLFAVREITAAQERNSHRLKITCISNSDIRRWSLARRWYGPAFDLESGRRAESAVQRQEIDHARGTHSW